MDEYRPFPAQAPADLEDETPSEEASAVDATTPGSPSRLDHEPSHEAPAERTAPDTEHPGGHLHGTVARLNRPRRFGFLRADDGAEVFFHASALDTGPTAFDALRPGQDVEFECHQDEQGRGLAATVVTVIGEPPEPAPRQPRLPKPERQSREPRGVRGGTAAAGWRVAVLRERFDSPLTNQLERLLNERNVRPGQFALTVVERQEGTECWVIYHTGDKT